MYSKKYVAWLYIASTDFIKVKSAQVSMCLLVISTLGTMTNAYSQSATTTSNELESLEGSKIEQSSYTLTARPESCVALHKGQRCFMRVTLSWVVPDAQEYCLFNDSESTPLSCSSETTGSIVTAFASASSTMFHLRAMQSEQLVASTVVSTSWVYRTGRRSSSSWRLF